MRNAILRLALALGALALTAACTTLTPIAGRPLEQRVSEDLNAFNEAMANSSSSLLLWNILRARDRLPRNFYTVKDITTTQTRSFGQEFGLGGLNFGGDVANDPWGVGTLGLSTSSQSEPSYGITPMVSQNFVDAVIRPTRPDVFQHYWNSWGPQDVLLGVLVEEATQLTASPAAFEPENCPHPNQNPRGATPLQRAFGQVQSHRLRNEFDEPPSALNPRPAY